MVLLSPKFLSYMKRGITFGQKYYTHPFVWNKQRNEPELSTCKRRLFLWYLNVLITLVYSLFLMVRSLQVNLDGEASDGEKIYMRFIIFWNAFPAVFQLTIYLKKEEFSRFFIMSSTFFQGIDEHEEKEKEQEQDEEEEAARTREFKIPKLYELFLDFARGAFYIIWFGWSIISIVLPHGPDKISSILLNQGEGDALIWKILVLSFCIPFQSYYFLLYTGNAFLWIFSGFPVFFAALVLLKQIKSQLELSAMRTESGSGSESLTHEKVKIILDAYKSLELVMKHFHQIYCTLVIPASKFITMSLTVFCTYGAIKMTGFLPVFLVPVGVTAVGALIAIIASMAWLHTYSKEILFLTKSPQFQRNLDKAGRKYVEALNIIQLKMGSSYYVDKECVITVFRTVVESTVNFLLAYS